MKLTIYLLFLILLTYTAFATCDINSNANNITLYDYIVPEGIGADCNASIYLSGVFQAQSAMATPNGLFYSANFSGFEYNKNYYAYITCTKASDYFYSDCYFNITEDITETRTALVADINNLEYRYYFEVNKSNEIRLYGNTTGSNAFIQFNESSFLMYNASDYFYLSFTSPIKDDADFLVNKTNASNSTTFTATGTMRFRIPFYADFFIYKDNKEKTPQLYTTQFQYVFLKFQNQAPFAYANSSRWLNTWNLNLNSFLAGGTPKQLDTELALWGEFADGKARIKIYEAGNYTLNLETTRTKKSIPWEYEFIYPQDSHSQYHSKITNVEINQEQNQEIKIYASMWDISKSRALFNWVAIAIVLLIWIAAVIFSFYTGNLWIISTIFFGGGLIALAIIRSSMS